MKKPTSVIRSHDHYANQIKQPPAQPVKPNQQVNPLAPTSGKGPNLNPLKGVIKGGKG